MGVTTGAISNTITTAGATQTTNNPFDIKITGDSFFIVNDGTQTILQKQVALLLTLQKPSNVNNRIQCYGLASR